MMIPLSRQHNMPESLLQWHAPPTIHLRAPRGWMNDPCAPGFDVVTGTYHLFYQWNPESCDWGNICWGHFTSRDGIFWEHNGIDPVLSPSKPYDKHGIFTGCFYPSGPKGEKGQSTLIYSSICALPIHWTRQYTRNCAGLALAVSVDKGKTWRKSQLNPILEGEPEGIVVTGYRDPYLAEWPALDTLRGKKSLYGIVSGGIVGKGPGIFLYEVPPDDLSNWQYLGPVMDAGQASSSLNPWSGNFGLNWECVNFMSLQDGAEQFEFLIMGSEGGLKPGCRKEDQNPYGVWPLWMAGVLERTESGIQLKRKFDGVLDNGCLYAASSYKHPVTKKTILWGWLKEEDLTLDRREAKGWTGYLSIPREIFLLRKKNVLRAWKTPLASLSSMLTTHNNDRKTQTIRTLGIRPLSTLTSLRQFRPSTWHSISSGKLASPKSTCWELEAVICVQPGHQQVGFHIRHNEDMSQRTSIYFCPEKEEIKLEKRQSNNKVDIKKEDVTGKFTLLVLDKGGSEMVERLHLRIFSDGDVLEIFANDRFALSATVYTDVQTCVEISAFEKGGVGNCTFESVKIWEDLTPVQRISATVAKEEVRQADTLNKLRRISTKERELGVEWVDNTAVTVS